MRPGRQLRLGCYATAVGLGFSLPGLARAQRVAIAEVVVSPTDAQVQVLGTMQFFAVAFDRGGNALASVTSFVWRSSNPRVASIDAYGLATGLSPGVTLITARLGSGRSVKTSQPATLTVLGRRAGPTPGPGCAAVAKEPPGTGTAEGLIITPLRLLLVRGEPGQLQYRAMRADSGTAPPVCIVFSIEEGGEGIAEVDSSGIVRAGQDTGHAVVRAVVPEHPRWQPKEITVDVRADNVTFAERELSMALGATDTLTMVVPAQGNRRINPVGLFQFMSSDTTKVRVSPIAPIVTAVGPGVALVVARSPFYPDLIVTVVVRRERGLPGPISGHPEGGTRD